MGFQVDTYQRDFPQRPGATVYRLHDPEAGCGAEICPEMGGNVFRWHALEKNQPVELLYFDPEVFPGGRPTRSGIPVLFPFPNRIRDGHFHWSGKDYQLPLNDPAGKNAIHGFACRSAWNVQERGADATSAWLTFDYRTSRDAPAVLPLWPADQHLTLRVQLFADRLRLTATVQNPDKNPLPFGLGFHPYFRLATPDTKVLAPARSFWDLKDSLPTGTRLPVDAARDLNSPRAAGSLTLDDVLTDLPEGRINGEGLVCRGQSGRVQLWISREFRDLVVFTPPHRQAFCIEPYTCTTDAANLEQRGVDAGWRVLPPGATWQVIVDLLVVAP